MSSWDAFWAEQRMPVGGKVVPFFYGHVSLMQLNEHDQAVSSSVPDWLRRLKAQSELGPCFTGLYYGKPMLSFGIIPIWPGLAEAWMIPDRDIGRVAVPLCRVARAFFNHCDTVMGLRRTQILVRSSNVRAVEWAKFLYFETEATLTAFGPDGEDYLMMRRLKNGRFVF
jgi:hypothetical protein